MATSDSPFKRFKFNSKPPPLPPKDSIYLERNNPSVSSIDNAPNSPISPPSISPSAFPSDRVFTRKDKALAFLKFPKRSPRSPSGSGNGEGSIIIISNDDLENPPPPEPDSQISTPWNFQHNIHVDEGYIGLPPSWSTSLASAGFTPEEITDIQARRAAGALAPDLRYLYSERPTSPIVAGFQSAAVPILSNPTSRTASLPLTESVGAPVRKPITSSSLARPPPPKRKPPVPTEDHSQNPKQPSSFTNKSSDSHQSNLAPFSSHNGQSAAVSSAKYSTPYIYKNPSSTSNLSSHSGHSTTSEDGQTPLAKASFRLGPSDSNDALSRSTPPPQTDSSPSTRFLRMAVNALSDFGVARKLEEGETEDRPRADDRTTIIKPILGTKRAIIPITGKLSNPSLSSLASSVTPLHLQQQQMSQSALTSSSFVAAASSSLSTIKVAAASTSLSIAAAMRNTKGAIRRGLGTSKDSDDSENVENPEDEEFMSDVLEIDATSGVDDDLSVPAEQGGRKAVWQLYTRPRTSTEASSKPLDANQQQPTNVTNATREGGSSYQSYLPFSRSAGSLRSLIRHKQIIKTNSQDSLNMQGSVSQTSLDSVSAATASGSGTGSGLGTGDVRFMKKYQISGSVSSLESIPETDGLPPHPYAMASNAASSSSAPSKKPSVTPAVLPTTRPPHLTLPHQSKASLDLSLWSETLLSGISRSAELDLALTYGEDEKETAEGRKEERGRDKWHGKSVTEDEMGVNETEQGKDEEESGSPLPTARPFGYPIQTTHTNRNMSATIAGTTRRQQQSIPPKPRYPAPARPIPPIIANSKNASPPTSIPLGETPPPYPTGRSRSNSHSKPSSPTGLTIPPSAILSPFSPFSHSPNGLVASPHHHHGYGQSPKPPPAVPLPPPPYAASGAPSTTSNNNNNTTAASTAMASRAILSPPPTPAAPLMAASMLSPPASAYPSQSLKSPTSSTGPDSAQLWSEIEAMMDPGLMQKMGLTGAGAEMGASRAALGPPPGGVKSSVKTADGAGGPVLGQSQAQAPRFATAGPDLNVGTSRTGLTIKVSDVGPSSNPSVTLTECFSSILPFTPEEERVAATRVLRAGKGVLGTKAHGHGGKGEEGEGDGGDSEYTDVRDLKEEGDGSDGSDYSDQEEPVVYVSDAPRSTDGLLIPDNHARQHSREHLARDQASRDSSHSSSSTLTAEAVAAAAAATTIVRKVSIARRAGAVVLKRGTDVNSALLAPAPAAFSNRRNSPSPPSAFPAESKQHPSSPLSSNFENSSEESAGSLSHSLSPSTPPQDNYPTPGTESSSLTSPLMYYLDGTQTPSPLPEKVAFGALPPLPSAAATMPQPSRMKTQNEGSIHNYDYNYSPGLDDEEDNVPFAYPDEAMVEAVHASMAAAAAVPAQRPTIVISDEPFSASITTSTTSVGPPLSPFQQYRGWLSAIVAPLEEFIDEGVDPRNHYLDLKEIAEGESGSVFSARLNPLTASKLRLPSIIKAKDAEEMSQHPEQVKLVAIKSVAIVPSGSPKLVDLQRELMLMKELAGHENVLGMDGVYVDLVEDSLWVRMELMERSLADMVGLVGNGLMLQDRMLARFASDVLSALEYLQRHSIAHRDVRSDNLLLNKHGFLKLADFSNAVQVTKDSPMRTDPAGVVFWQAPEVRKPPYNVLKVDVWSLGATVWEMAQTEPPFCDTQQLGDRWPPLRQPELYSPAFHDFLRKCSEPASSRPNPSDLLKHPFVHNACGRPVIVHLLSQCMAIEQVLQQGSL